MSRVKKHIEELIMQNTAISFVFILFVAVLLPGCEKVIDVDLNEADPEIVIEANLSGLFKNAEVKVSKTASYFGDEPIEKVTGAKVAVENDFGEIFNLKEVETGLYRIDDIPLQSDVTYKLSVKVEKKEFFSSSKLNRPVKIDSLKYYYDDGFAYMDAGYVVKIYFSDPPQKYNYYRIKIYENDTLRDSAEDMFVFDDRLIDGQTLEVNMRGIIFDPGDTVKVQLMSLDKGAFEYFKTFNELINVNPGSAAPANPTSNITNGALGYFSAWSASEKSVVIKENFTQKK